MRVVICAVRAACFGAVLTTSVAARTQLVEEAAAPESAALPQRLVGHAVVGTGVDAVVPAGDQCSQDVDVVDCTSEQFFGLDASGFYAPLPWISIGGGGLFAVRPGVEGAGGTEFTSETTRQYFHALGQARFHPYAFGPLVPWLGAEIGFAAMRERTVTKSLTSGKSTSTTTDTAFTLGAGIGVDLWIVERFALSGQFSLLYEDLERGTPTETLPLRRSFYTSPIVFIFGIGVRVLI